MAVLGGDNGTPSGYGTSGAADDVIWTYAGYTFSAGTAATAHAYIGTEQSGANMKILIVNSSSSLVATSDAIALSFSAENSGAISASLSATTYYLGIVGDGYISTSDQTGGSWQTEIAANSYTTPTAFTVNDGEASAAAGAIGVWIEDSGASTTPYINYYHYLYGGGGVGL